MNAYKELIRDSLNLVNEERNSKEWILSSREASQYFSAFKAPAKPLVTTAQAVSLPTPKLKPEPKPIQEVKREPVAQVPPQKAQKTSTPAAFNLTAAEEWKKELSRHFPQMTVLDTILEDTRAKELSTLWKKYQLQIPVLILSFGENEEDLLFIKNLAKAIQTHLKPVKILDALSLEKEKKWETLFDLNAFDLVIASEAGLMDTQELKRIYQSGFKTPLLFLNPEIKKDKAALWKRICQILKR